MSPPTAIGSIIPCAAALSIGWHTTITEPSRMSPFDLNPPTPAQRQQLISTLNAEERHVLLQHGTEAPYCGIFVDNHLTGIYTCRLCGLPLFRSSSKFDSGSGWPSFHTPYHQTHIVKLRDRSHGMLRTEIVCARCGSHLGHVFADGPPPSGERHCLNSLSLAFSAAGAPLPDPLQRGGAEALPG
jgi:peptide-methionine (R)-S-oxide reductase